MKRYLKNLRELFSDDDQVVFNALKEKKDWINQSFYIVCSLQTNQDIEDIMDRKIRFRSLYVNPALCSKEEYEKTNEDFSTFKVLYLYNEIPYCEDEGEFVLKLDFSRLTDREYRMLFANFYPCLDSQYILEDEDDEILSLLKKGMDKLMGDNVIIMANMDLVDSCFNCDVFSQLIVNKNLNDGYMIHLRLLCEKMKIQFKEI